MGGEEGAEAGHRSRTSSRVRTTSGCPVVFLIVYPICPRKQGQSAGKTGPLTRTIPRPRGRAFQLCIIGFLYAYAAYVKAADGAGYGLYGVRIFDFHFLLFSLSLLASNLFRSSLLRTDRRYCLRHRFRFCARIGAYFNSV